MAKGWEVTLAVVVVCTFLFVSLLSIGCFNMQREAARQRKANRELSSRDPADDDDNHHPNENVTESQVALSGAAAAFGEGGRLEAGPSTPRRREAVEYVEYVEDYWPSADGLAQPRYPMTPKDRIGILEVHVSTSKIQTNVDEDILSPVGDRTRLATKYKFGENPDAGPSTPRHYNVDDDVFTDDRTRYASELGSSSDPKAGPGKAPRPDSGAEDVWPSAFVTKLRQAANKPSPYYIQPQRFSEFSLDCPTPLHKPAECPKPLLLSTSRHPEDENTWPSSDGARELRSMPRSLADTYGDIGLEPLITTSGDTRFPFLSSSKDKGKGKGPAVPRAAYLGPAAHPSQATRTKEI